MFIQTRNLFATSRKVQKSIKCFHNIELFVQINLTKDDPNLSGTTLFVQGGGIKKLIHTFKNKVMIWYLGNILRLRCTGSWNTLVGFHRWSISPPELRAIIGFNASKN
jgi:hypothetical protein